MFISVTKTGNGRYIFAVGDEPSDDRRAWVESYADAAILGDTPSSFTTFGEAHAAASRLIDDRPSCILAKKASILSMSSEMDGSEMSPEEQVIDQYNQQVSLVGQRVSSLSYPGEKNDAEFVKKEIDGIKSELEKLLALIESDAGKKKAQELLEQLAAYASVVERLVKTKMASSCTPVSLGIRKATVRSFSEAALMAIATIHEDVFVKGAIFDPLSSSCESVLASPRGNIVRLSFDRNMLLTGIVPCDQAKCQGMHSVEFYRRYWEPIVASVGHFHSRSQGVVAVPALDQRKRGVMRAFSMTDNSESSLIVKKAVIYGNETWLVKKASSLTVPPNSPFAIGDEVECTAQHLKTYLGRTGSIEEVAQKADGFSYHIDFRRGLGMVWMDGKDIKKVILGV